MSMIAFVEAYKKQCLPTLQCIQLAHCYTEIQADVIMATAHREKGREWAQVRLHNDFKGIDTVEEKNIFYVALTRASRVLDYTGDKIP